MHPLSDRQGMERERERVDRDRDRERERDRDRDREGFLHPQLGGTGPYLGQQLHPPQLQPIHPPMSRDPRRGGSHSSGNNY